MVAGFEGFEGNSAGVGLIAGVGNSLEQKVIPLRAAWLHEASDIVQSRNGALSERGSSCV